MRQLILLAAPRRSTVVIELRYGLNKTKVQAYAAVDLAVQKDVALTGSARLQLRWEIFNFFSACLGAPASRR